MLMDKKNNLWILTGGDKLGIFNTKTFTYREVPLKPTNEIWVKKPKGIVKDEYGNILVVIAHCELLTYNEEKNEISPAYNFIHFPREWISMVCFSNPVQKNTG
ncbi:MAG: hypothetical protein WDO71_28100 [Bacteroidota bacterium]